MLFQRLPPPKILGEFFIFSYPLRFATRAGALRGIKVRARSSSFQFRGQEQDVREVGRSLGVGAVLEGSVRMAGGRLRITVELVNCEDGYQIWSRRYDREMKDVFETQDEIVAKVVEALKVPLGAGDAEPERDYPTPDLEAYHLYLKGRHLRYTKLNLAGALECFKAAVERDPSFAAAHAAWRKPTGDCPSTMCCRRATASRGRGKSCGRRSSSAGSSPNK